MSYNTSSYNLTNRCPNATTTDCVTYTGPNIPCLGICTNDLLTDLECAIATNLCVLVGEVNVSTVVIPECLQTAWGSNNPTILNFFNFILQQACIQQVAISSLQAQVNNLDPIITVTYPQGCPCTNQCNPGATLTVSKHLENILTCLCNLYSLLGTLPVGYSSFGCAISTLGTDINNLYNGLQGQFDTILQILQVLNTQVITNGNTIPQPSPPIQPSFNC